MFCFPRFCRGSYTPHPIDTQWSYDPQINTTKMMLFSDKKDSRWTGDLFDIYSCCQAQLSYIITVEPASHPASQPPDRQSINNAGKAFKAGTQLGTALPQLVN